MDSAIICNTLHSVENIQKWRNPTNITELKWFCTKERAQTPTCYCAGLIIYKKLYLQLLQQKRVTPDAESKDSHTKHRYVTLHHFSQ